MKGTAENNSITADLRDFKGCRLIDVLQTVIKAVKRNNRKSFGNRERAAGKILIKTALLIDSLPDCWSSPL